MDYSFQLITLANLSGLCCTMYRFSVGLRHATEFGEIAKVKIFCLDNNMTFFPVDVQLCIVYLRIVKVTLPLYIVVYVDPSYINVANNGCGLGFHVHFIFLCMLKKKA